MPLVVRAAKNDSYCYRRASNVSAVGHIDLSLDRFHKPARRFESYRIGCYISLDAMLQISRLSA